jgi:energy-coupling factor transporter ATP-binding protein EcfA2
MNGERDTYIGDAVSGWGNSPLNLTEKDRLRHIYIIGRTGSGKSTLLENIALQDIHDGLGCAFFDPHGDSATRILERIPSHRTRDVVYLRPADIDRPLGINVLESVPAESVHLVAQGVVSAFRNIWKDSWGPRMDRIFYNAVSAILAYGHGTLLGVLRILVDNDFRKLVLESIEDPMLHDFWAVQYPGYQERFKQEAIDPIQNKVERFLSSSVMRNILGQKHSTIDLRFIMNNRRILIVDLSKGEIGELYANLLGSLLITLIQLVAMERGGRPPEKRDHFPLFVDEFHSFSSDSFLAILSEARKFGLSITMAHQYIAQLSDELQDSVLGNVGSLVAFRMGSSDAERIAKEFEPWPESALSDLDNYFAFAKLLIGGEVMEPYRTQMFYEPFPFGTPESLAKRRRKIITFSRTKFGSPQKEVEDKIKRWMEAKQTGIRNASLRQVTKTLKTPAKNTDRKNRG